MTLVSAVFYEHSFNCVFRRWCAPRTCATNLYNINNPPQWSKPRLQSNKRVSKIITKRLNLFLIFSIFFQNSVEKIDACSTAGVADVYFVLYSNTDRSSFKEAVLIVKYLVETRNISQASIFLIATKKDLKYQQDVTEYEGRLLAMELGCEFYTISSSEGYEGTQDVLRGSLRSALNKHSKENGGSKSPLMKRVKNGLRNKTHHGVPHPPLVIDTRERTATLW